jgi:hypothetical protein
MYIYDLFKYTYRNAKSLIVIAMTMVRLIMLVTVFMSLAVDVAFTVVVVAAMLIMDVAFTVVVVAAMLIMDVAFTMVVVATMLIMDVAFTMVVVTAMLVVHMTMIFLFPFIHQSGIDLDHLLQTECIQAKNLIQRGPRIDCSDQLGERIHRPNPFLYINEFLFANEINLVQNNAICKSYLVFRLVDVSIGFYIVQMNIDVLHIN